MKTYKFEDKEAWLKGRKTRITGSRLKDIIVKRGTEKKKGFYELIAERIEQDVSEDAGGYVPNETPMDRGTRLEKYAIERFIQETGKKVDTSLYIWTRDENESIAISPDGVVIEPKKKKQTEAVECKCLSSASHLEAYLTNKIPDEYYTQGLQYMIVNDDIDTVNFVFYDPRIPMKDFFIIPMYRENHKEDIAGYLDYQLKTIAEVDQIVAQLTGF